MFGVVTDVQGRAEIRVALDEILLDGARATLAAACSRPRSTARSPGSRASAMSGHGLPVRKGRVEPAHDHPPGRPVR